MAYPLGSLSCWFENWDFYVVIVKEMDSQIYILAMVEGGIL